MIPTLIKIRVLDGADANTRLTEIRTAEQASRDTATAAHLKLVTLGSLESSAVSDAYYRALESRVALEEPGTDVASALAHWRGPFFGGWRNNGVSPGRAC